MVKTLKFRLIFHLNILVFQANGKQAILFPSPLTFLQWPIELRCRNALVIGFPEGGGDPGLMWGNTGTLWGLCNKFLPLWWGKCGDFDFGIPYSREECGDFASVQLRGDKERSIVPSIHGKMVEEKEKVSSKIHCFLSIK